MLPYWQYNGFRHAYTLASSLVANPSDESINSMYPAPATACVEQIVSYASMPFGGIDYV